MIHSRVDSRLLHVPTKWQVKQSLASNQSGYVRNSKHSVSGYVFETHFWHCQTQEARAFAKQWAQQIGIAVKIKRGLIWFSVAVPVQASSY